MIQLDMLLKCNCKYNILYLKPDRLFFEGEFEFFAVLAFEYFTLYFR